MVMSFPECIYAVGGAGKELIFNMLRQEWILKEILRPDHNQNKCIVTVVDTCLEDENTDRRVIKEIEEKISRITADFIDSSLYIGLNVGEIKICYHLLTRELLLESPVDLGGLGVKNAVLRATDAEFWWINDENISDDWYQKIKSRENLQNLNFAKGVYRKRAIAKAIYYKAISENKFEVEVFGSNIDIICGFGGGTGSGIALSLAKKIKAEKPASDIHLFGVISTLKESDEEKANCAAMLSELEYMKITDSGSDIHKKGTDIPENTIFKNIVLLPIEPTEYGGEQNMNAKLQKQILEYDDVFPYVLIAFHNTPGGQPAFLDSRSLAPFSIAVPQLVRYNVDYIRQIKDTLSEKISAKDGSLKSENAIYELVSSYLTKYCDPDSKNIKNKYLIDEDNAFVQERYKQFKTVLDFKYFDELQYKNVLKLREIVKKIDRKEFGETEYNNLKIEQVIKNIQSEIEGEGLDDIVKSSTDIDNSTYNILADDLDKINLLINIIKEINTLNDDSIKRILKNCVKPQKDETLGRRLTKIKDAIESAELEGESIRQVYEELKQDCIKFRTEIEENSISEDRDWKNNSRSKFKKLSEIEEAKVDLIESFDSVKNKMEIYAREISEVKTESKIKEIDVNRLEKEVSELFKKMDLYRLDYHELKDINPIFLKMKEIKLEDIKAKKKLSSIDRIVPGDTRAKIDKKDAKLLRDKHLNELKHSFECIKYADGIFSFDLNYDVKEKIDNKFNEHLESILFWPKEKYFNTETERLFENLESVLKDPHTRENVSIEELVKSYFKYHEGIQAREEMISKKQKELKKISLRIEKYRALQFLLKNIAKHYNNHLNLLDDYNSYFFEADARDENRRHILEEDLFVTEIQPKEIFQILASQSDINRVIRNDGERQLLVKKVKDSFNKIRSRKYNTLVAKSFSNEEVRWEWTSLGCVIVTNAKDIEREIFEGISTDLIKEFCIVNRRNFNNWIVRCGDDWGVGIVTFISSIPLDNINNFVDVMEGYFNAYQKMKKDPDKLSVLHNSLLLEKGKFVERVKTFDFENSAEVKSQFLEDEKKAKELILRNLEVKNLKEIANKIN
jgi:hypothetical protein